MSLIINILKVLVISLVLFEDCNADRIEMKDNLTENENMDLQRNESTWKILTELNDKTNKTKENEVINKKEEEECVGAPEFCNLTEVEYVAMLNDYIYPHTYEWVLIGTHTLVFIMGLGGNALVCVAVYRNHAMRTVTNYFIVNLAVADFMVILFCLPPTVLWDVTETWFLGDALCKILLYFQSVSVTVSVLTLTFISVDRWYAICFPLKFKSTTGRAKTAILIIWSVSLLFKLMAGLGIYLRVPQTQSKAIYAVSTFYTMIRTFCTMIIKSILDLEIAHPDSPELVILTTEKMVPLRFGLEYLIQCVATWPLKYDLMWHVIKIVLIYTMPLLLMSVAYYQIVKVLWRSEKIPGQAETMELAPAEKTQLRSRRKAAKMLVAVVIMFAVCYFPVHLLSVLRYTLDIEQNDALTFLALVSHVMCYSNSAINPLIYNFMSDKFRREFRRTFCCDSASIQDNFTNLTHITTFKKKSSDILTFENRGDVRRNTPSTQSMQANNNDHKT